MFPIMSGYVSLQAAYVLPLTLRSIEHNCIIGNMKPRSMILRFFKTSKERKGKGEARGEAELNTLRKRVNGAYYTSIAALLIVLIKLLLQLI